MQSDRSCVSAAYVAPVVDVACPQTDLAPVARTIADPAADARWDAYVAARAEGSLYHHSAWIGMVRASYGYRSACLALVGRKGAFAGVAPLGLIRSALTGSRLVAFPFADFGQPLADDEAARRQLIAAIAELGRQWKVRRVELRFPGEAAWIEALGYELRGTYKRHVLALDKPLEALRAATHKSCIQRNIRKAERSRLEVVRGHGDDALRTFYRLQSLTRRRHGLPPQPIRFFRQMRDALAPAGMLDILLAIDAGRPVAGILLGRHGDTLYYLYGGSTDDPHPDQPNHLLLWRGIEMAVEEGRRFFDFGRTSLDNAGLLDFKRRWGAAEQDLVYYQLSGGRPRGGRRGEARVGAGPMRRLAEKIIVRTPVAWLEWLGNLIYRHMG